MSYQALLFCPDDKTARVVTQVLTELDFTVEPCNEPFAAVKKLMAQHFDAIVVDCDNEQNAALLFKSARNSGSNASSLAVAVVEGQAGVAKAFRIGANLVLTKPINVEQSKGTLRVARGLLRKADSAKPAGTTPEAKPITPTISEQPRAAAPAPAPMKPLVAAFTTPKPPTAPPAPVARETGFEREADPGPKPDSTEAALLESMTDPSHAAKPFATPPSKEYPWQPVSKLAEPMASALRLAAETASKPSTSAVEPETTTPDWGTPIPAAGETRTLSSATVAAQSSASGTATAPAPAKHDLRISAQTIQFENTMTAAPVEEPKAEPAKISEIPREAPRVEPPTFAALAVKDHEEEEESQEGGKKAYIIVALVVLAAAFTAYMLYQKSHTSDTPSPSQPQVQQTSPAPAPTTGNVNQSPTPTTTANQATPSASQDIVLGIPKPSAGTSKKPVSDVTVIKFPDSKIQTPSPEPAATEEAPAPQALIVKSSAPAAAPRTVEADVAPPPAMTGPSDDKALASIAAVSPTAIAKPVASTLKVSQGVSQGLLVKRVQPVYPQQAIQMRIEGSVLLDAVITKDGKISNVKVAKGDNVLAKAAVDAVKQWKYNPYFLNGEPVDIQTQINITFKLP
jgi:protein TonB